MMTTATTTADLAGGVRLATLRLARRLRQERTDATLSLTQLATLAALHWQGPCTPGELAEREQVQPPSMTRVLAALQRRGLLRREVHPGDRRQHLVSTTAAAERLLEEDRRARDAWLAARLERLPAEDLTALRRALPVLDALARS
jgi:DNA-binding MarR family transcriptional regulator